MDRPGLLAQFLSLVLLLEGSTSLESVIRFPRQREPCYRVIGGEVRARLCVVIVYSMGVAIHSYPIIIITKQ